MKKVISFLAVFSFFALTFSTPALAVDFYPGQEIRFAADAAEWGDQKPSNELSTSYYSIAGQDWRAGRELVASVSINNTDNVIVLTLKPDYQSTKPKTLAGTIKVRDKSEARFLTLTINCSVGNLTSAIDIQPDGNIPTLQVEPNTVYTVTATDNGYPYGTLMFNTDIADVAVRVYDKDKLYLEYDRTPNKEILINNADANATMEFLSFKANPTFSSVATLTFYGANNGSYLYEVRGNKLTRLATTWDNENNALVYKTRTLGSYVLSDVALNATGTVTTPGTSTGTDTNPPTGVDSVAAQALALITLSGIGVAMAFRKREG